MSLRALFHTLVARTWGFLRPGGLDADFDQEMAAHLAAAEDDGVRRGLTPEEARRAARVQLGGLTQLREASRAAQGLPWLGSFWLDIKLGVRLLFKYPGLTLVSTLALSIAIAIVAGFHAGTEFIVRPTLPGPESDRFVAIWNHDSAASDRGGQTVGDMLTWRRELAALEDVGAFVLQQRVVAAADGPTRLVRAAQISPSALRMLRIPPLMGRALVEDDERPGGPAVALIGFELWQFALGTDPAVVGKTIRVGGAEHTVVGVMPRGFAFPRREQLWTPLRIPNAGLRPGEGPAIDLSAGRLAPGVTLGAAEAELRVIGARLAADHRQTHARLRPRIATYARSFIEANEPGLALMMSAARVLIGIVLLVVAVNVGTLVYARNAARVGEVALRLALGASRRRIATQMFLEALVLASLAAAVGVAVMAWPLYLLGEAFDTVVAQGDSLPYWFNVRVGPSTALLVVGLVLLSAVLTGILPALKLTDRHMRSRLQRVQDGVSGLRFGKAATIVIVSQVAISVALLTVGGAQLRTFVEDWMSLDDSGPAREGYLAAELRWDPAPSAYSEVEAGAGDIARRAETWLALGRQLSQEPDVRGVTFETFQGVRPFEASSSEAAAPRWTYVASIEPNYFEVYDAPLRTGRAFDAADASNAVRRVAIVNEEFVRTVLPVGQPLGQRVRPVDPRSGRPSGASLEIIGVVRDFLNFEISQRGPGWVAHPTIYVPLAPTASTIRMTVRVRDDAAQFVPRLREMAAGLDPALVVHRPTPLEEIDQIDTLFLRVYGFGVGFLVSALLLLSTAGVYSMMSFTVAQRTREIGIRTALGAQPTRVIGEIFARALLQVGAGTTLGLVIGFAASDGPFALSDGLFHHGPGPILAVATLVIAMGLIACANPLRRALRIQPTEALRAER
jgi:putative ABC transport system permease protein